MKSIKVLLITVVLGILTSCGGGGYSGSEVSTKEEYYELKQSVEQCKKDFKAKEISESTYSSRMEDYGDVYVKSVDAIPPERRYRVAIYCYKEALKYNKKDKDLKKKLQEQRKLFQVVNQ
jgi:cobalamin biosynthesis Co2+ chelatase CbiK